MKILYQDLINQLSEKPSKELLSEKLFQLGHEHEIYGDIFDMELTPNRGDCLSLVGLSRDLNVFFGRSKNIDIYEDEIKELELNFENLSPEDCPKISFLEIEIDEIKAKYKPYLENYFDYLDINKTNLFTDISNYISYELGQPTHCYDLDKIKNKLIFENKECNTTFKTVLGSEIKLKDNNCVFSMNGEVVSLAGVMGGISTACSTNTKKVLIECAFFNPESIISKSLKYNLTSDAAHKFERGVDINCHEYVLRRFIKIAQDHAKVTGVKFKTFSLTEVNATIITFDARRINKILGTQIDKSTYLNYLNKLGFEVSGDDIYVPTYRNDIKSQNDIAEEIARAIGYNNIKSTPISFDKINKDKNLNKSQILAEFLTQHGFSEVINFPFISTKDKDAITIDNPLDSNRKYLRTNLKDSLIENLLFNERRQKDSIKLFEISDIYTKSTHIINSKKLGIIISGRSGRNYLNFSKELDKDYLDDLLNKNPKYKFFEIEEIKRSSLETKKKNKIFYVEVDIGDIPDDFFIYPHKSNRKPINFIKYKPVSEFPISTRDFSFLITDLSKVKIIIDDLEQISDEIIKDSFMFDFYKNPKTESVKVGFRFIFQSSSKTLSEEEINDKINQIINPITNYEGVSIPGM